jgi:hypothetical protein
LAIADIIIERFARQVSFFVLEILNHRCRREGVSDIRYKKQYQSLQLVYIPDLVSLRDVLENYGIENIA